MATIIRFSRIKARPERVLVQSGQARKGIRVRWLFVLGAIAACLFYFTTRPAEVLEVNVRFTICDGGGGARNCVIDGDTIRLGGEKVRLIGLDAPEIFSPSCSQERAIGIMARQELLHALNNGPFQVMRYRGDNRDVYGRKLRVVERDRKPLAGQLIAKGLATPGRSDSTAWCS